MNFGSPTGRPPESLRKVRRVPELCSSDGSFPGKPARCLRRFTRPATMDSQSTLQSQMASEVGGGGNLQGDGDEKPQPQCTRPGRV